MRYVGMVLAALAVLGVVLLGNTLRSTPPKVTVAPVRDLAVDAAAVADKLAALVRLRTISNSDPALTDPRPFEALHDQLRRRFPLLHQKLSLEQLGQNLIYRWAGSDATAPPLLLLAHQDVVPVEPGSEGKWQVPPWDGRISGGFVWGRGALDDKLNLVAELEAVEQALAHGFAPRRTVYLCFGADEEVGGHRGAALIAERLAERGVRPLLVLDEGMPIAEGMLPVAPPVALIGIAEKGYLSLELRVDLGGGGHSSMPPKQTAVGVLAAALTRLEAHPLPARLTVAERLFTAIAPELPFGKRMIMANLWLFAPLVKQMMTGAPQTNAMVRTTTAETMFSAGVKDNVLPSTAQAVVNFRLLPGDSVAGVTAQVAEIIADARVQVVPLPGGMIAEPSPASPTDGPAFALLSRTVRQIFPTAMIAPGLVLGATDSRHYARLTDAVYRFSAIRFHADDAARLHGVDERVAIADLGHLVEFYWQLLRNGDRAW